MADSNGHTLTKTPDVNGVITIDLDADGITTSGNAPSNFPLIFINGTEVKGIVFTRGNTAESVPQELAEMPTTDLLQWIVFRPAGAPVLFRHNSGDVPAHAKIVTEGYYPNADAVMGAWNHFGVWRYNATLEKFALHVALFIVAP